MVVYVGVDLADGVMAHVSDDRAPVTYRIKKANFERSQLNAMFQEITKKLYNKGKSKCVCLYIWVSTKQIRKTIIELGVKFGLEKVIISDEKTLQCLSFILETEYTLHLDDTIVLVCDKHLYLWENKKCQNDIIFKNNEGLNVELINLKVSPNIIIYIGEGWVNKKWLFKKIFSDFQFFYYTENSVRPKSMAHLALYYAQIMTEKTASNIVLYPCTHKSYDELFCNFEINGKNQINNVKNDTNVIKETTPQSFTVHETLSIPKKKVNNEKFITAVGIDLGMSQCCVAVNRRNGIETVAIDNNGERVLPSFVAYDEIHEKCGQVVVDRLRFHSESTVFDSKRIIGRNFEEIEIDTMWPFYLNSDKNKPFIKIRNYKKELVSKSAEQVAASLLKYIRKKTEEFQGKRLHRAVITVPASFTNTQKNSTRSAASLAGWDSVYLLSEPVAASFTYFVNQEAPNNTILLLFDLGGGTLDVCLSKIKDNKIITISNSGNSQVGGRNFDNILIKYFIEKLKNDFDITVADGKKYKLILECQKIKHSLSVQMQEALDVEDFDIAKEGFIKIDRQIFETLSQDLLTNIKDAIKNTLYYSGHKAHKINKVLLVGGSCRMPMIKKLLQDMFPNSEHCCDEHPEEVVAIGAAYFAYNYFFA